ncbi:MAG: signal peptidase [Gemmatimonadetes bacterium]|nr:signal peptidase [Gemmatimonadota bacterium]
MGERRSVHRGGGRRATDHEPRRGWVPAAWIAAAIAAADWSAKWAVSSRVPLDDFVEVVPGRLAFFHVQNHAMMLGLWSSFPLGARQVIAVCGAAVGLLFLLQILGRGHRFTQRERPLAWLYVGLALGGMVGNLGERLVHWGVTDFLSLRWHDVWLPPGNLADVALFLSIPLSIPVILFEVAGRMRRRPGDEPSVSPEAGGAVEPATLA